MRDVLISMFKKLNRKAYGNYYVNVKTNEVGYTADGEAGSICRLEDINSATYLREDCIILDANEHWTLTVNGPEF